MVDGPCLHRAREALVAAASDERWLVAGGFDDPHGAAISALFRLIWSLRADWTETQMKYIRAVRDHLQTEVADTYDVSRQAVSKALDAARLQAVLDGESAARAYLRWIGDRAGSAHPEEHD